MVSSSLIHIASRASRRLLSGALSRMVVLATISRLVSAMSCLVWECTCGPPFCRCMVKRLDRDVVVQPMYPLLGRSVR